MIRNIGSSTGSVLMLLVLAMLAGLVMYVSSFLTIIAVLSVAVSMPFIIGWVVYKFFKDLRNK